MRKKTYALAVFQTRYVLFPLLLISIIPLSIAIHVMGIQSIEERTLFMTYSALHIENDINEMLADMVTTTMIVTDNFKLYASDQESMSGQSINKLRSLMTELRQVYMIEENIIIGTYPNDDSIEGYKLYNREFVPYGDDNYYITQPFIDKVSGEVRIWSRYSNECCGYVLEFAFPIHDTLETTYHTKYDVVLFEEASLLVSTLSDDEAVNMKLKDFQTYKTLDHYKIVISSPFILTAKHYGIMIDLAQVPWSILILSPVNVVNAFAKVLLMSYLVIAGIAFISFLTVKRILNTNVLEPLDQLNQYFKDEIKINQVDFHSRILEIKRLKHTLFELEERLAATEKDLKDFVYAASHDLKEPLRTISTYLDILKEDMSINLAPEEQRFFTYVITSAKRLESMISELLTLSRIDLDPDMAMVDLNVPLTIALNNLSSQISDQKANLVLEQMPDVRGNENLLTLVFQNLIGNSLKYSKPFVVIEVKNTPKGFKVVDDGIGFNMVYSDQVFKPFKRLHGTRDYDGTGLGLAMVKRIIEVHGWTIRVESVEGQGTTFYVDIDKEDPHE